MAEFRERPYSQFNYLVDLGTGDTDSAMAGFQEPPYGSGAHIQENMTGTRSDIRGSTAPLQGWDAGSGSENCHRCFHFSRVQK